MGDHVEEFNRILDYKDMLLETNPGSTCVVKLKDSESGNGMKQFHSFYICFDAMKKGFQQGCRRCIGMDGCFLKGICKGQVFLDVAGWKQPNVSNSISSNWYWKQVDIENGSWPFWKMILI